MKSVRNLVVLLLTLSLVFLGCDALGGGGDEEGGGGGGGLTLTSTDITNLSGAALGTGYITTQMVVMVHINAGGGTLGDAALEALHSGISCTTSGDTTTVTFTNVSLSTGESNSDTVSINGTLAYTSDATASTITVTSLSISNSAYPDMAGTVSGNLAMTSTAITLNASFSGVVSEAVTITMTMAVGDPMSVTAATINGTDYTTEFNTTLTTLFS